MMGDNEWAGSVLFESVSSRTRDELPAFKSSPTKFPSERMRTDVGSEPRDRYFDMDIALPFHWESMTGKGHKISKSSDSQEFEFNMSLDPPGSLDHDGISPADDLFYKGQLLPLHLPRRLQMVQKLSCPTKLSEAANASPLSVSRSFLQPSGTKFNTVGTDESFLASALVNSRCSSFHSQGSSTFWDSGDSGDSSSSRDSSGSSQDACVPEKHSHVPTLRDLKDRFAHESRSKEVARLEHRDFFTSPNVHQHHEKSVFSSWLRMPFKWKIFFGSKKSSKVKPDAKVGSEDPRRFSQGLKGFEDHDSFVLNVRSSRTGSYFSAEQKAGVREHLNDFSFPGSEKGSVREKDRDRENNSSKAKDSLHKYFHLLKPLHVKVSQRTEHSELNLKTVEIRSPSITSLPSPRPTLSGHLAPSKPPIAEKKSPPSHTLSGNLRVPSFARSSKVTASASSAVARVASPNHSGVLTSSSSMSELQSAIQGAIAHCKQSQVCQSN